MRGDFKTALDNLIKASGGRVWIVSGTRDTATQRRLWEKKLAEYGLPPDTHPDDPRARKARQWVAPPGNSNHEKGIAADLGGDLALAARLAPQFGLYRPMAHEPWHFEPIGSRGGASPRAYTEPPDDFPAQEPEKPQDLQSAFLQMLGVPTFEEFQSGVNDSALQNRLSVPDQGIMPERLKAPVYTSTVGGPDGIDAFMRAIRAQESSGNYKAIGRPTRWGTAKGAYQFLYGTWAGYGGYARADEAPPEVQDRRARELMQEYYNKFGSWDNVAAAWFSGPGGNWKSGQVQKYVREVKARL